MSNLLVSLVGLMTMLALFACGPNLQPRVTELENKVASLEKDKVAVQQDREKLQAQVGTLQKDKTALQQEKDKAQGQVTSLQREKTSAQQDKDRLQSQVASLEKDKVAAQQDKNKFERQNRDLKGIASPLPASLDNFFPPKAPAPVFLFEMFALDRPFAGIVTDLQQGDMAGVGKNFEAFKTQYAKVAGMVPEWKELLPMEPVEALGAALASGDPAKVGPAIGQLERCAENVTCSTRPRRTRNTTGRILTR